MRLIRSRLPLLLLALAAGALSCGPDLLGPGRLGVGRVALNPAFQSLRLEGSGEVLSVGSIVAFTRVRVVLLRANGDTAVDRLVDFPADADSVSLALPVTLSPTAPPEGETLGAVMRYVNAAGDTVFASAAVPVQARTATTGAPPVVTIPLTYVGPGSTAASLVITPDSVVGVRNQTVTFTSVVRDGQGAVLANTPVAFTSTDTAVVKIGLTTGAATLVGSRGTALVIAQTVTGQKDTARVRITPTATAIAVSSGNNQQVRQGGVFPQPLRVRVTAFDGLGVAGTVVDFVVTSGRGTLSAPRVTTDSGGFAEVQWTAGDTATVGSVVASVTGQTTLSTAFTGTQLSTGPAALAFTAPPRRIVAGDTLGPVVVSIANRFGEPVPSFRGSMQVALVGGPAGARLLGTTTVPVDSGLSAAAFRNLTVDRGGTGYRLVATLDAPVLTVTSDTFSVAPAPAVALELVQGDGQIGLANTALRDSIVVRARDRFGFPVAGTTLAFTAAGGGSALPTTATTSATGAAATRWTLGPSGPQTLAVTAAPALTVTATAAIPSSITVMSGAGQEALFGTAFKDTVVFRVTVPNGAPAIGVPVSFTVTGGGTLSQPIDTVETTGLVRVVWTAGNTPGTAVLTARIGTSGPEASVTGLQGSANPTTLALTTPVPSIAAGDTFPALRVEVRNGLAKPIPHFTGKVKLSLTGGTPGAQLLGTTVVAASGGIATFGGLSVDRAGAGYRLLAALDSATPSLATNSDTFRVTAAVPAAMALVSGGGQVVPAGVQLPDPIVVIVKDRFGSPVPGATVTFTVIAGGGTVAPSPVSTDPDGRAMGFWVAGAAGPQTLRVAVAGLSPLDVGATALATNGPPILFLGTATAQVGVGQRQPVTLFLSNPAPSPVTVTLTTRDSARVTWSAPTITIPVGASQATVSLVGMAPSAAPIWGIVSSAIGTDSLAVTVDSVHAGIVLPLGGALLVGDTLRTRIVLDRPAPTGGLVVRVQSADSARVRVAPGDGRGFLDDGACLQCLSLRDTAPSVVAPAGTADLVVPAGQLSAQLVVVAVAGGSATPDVALRVSGTHLAGGEARITPRARTLPVLSCGFTGIPCEVPVGHTVRLSGTLGAVSRQTILVRLRSLTPSLLEVVDSTATILLGDNVLYTGDATLIGKARGTAAIEIRAAGFPVDTLRLPVTDSLAVGLWWGSGANSGSPRTVGTRWDEWVALGYHAASATATFVSGPPLRAPVTITATSRTPAVVAPIIGRLEVTAGRSDLSFAFEAKSAGSAWVVFSAPGYGADSLLYVVDGQMGVSLDADAAAPGLTTAVHLSRWTSGAADVSTQAVAYTLSASDTAAIRVVTPTLVLPAGAWEAVGFIQARTAANVATLQLTAAAVGQAPVTTPVMVAAPALALGTTPRTPWADSARYQVAVWALNPQGFVVPVRDTVRAILRSSDPSVLLVTDSVVRLIPDDDSLAVGTIRPLRAGSATLTVSAPGFSAATSAPIEVQAFQLSASIPPAATVGLGLARRVRVYRRSPVGSPLGLSLGRRGAGVITLEAAVDTIAADSAYTDITLRGIASAGTDTLTISAAGHQPLSLVLVGGPSALRLQGPASLHVEDIVDVGGLAVGPCDGTATNAGWPSASCPQRVAATARFRLISLTPSILRVLDDTITVLPGQSAASRLGRVRALMPGYGRLAAISLDGQLGTSDTVAISIAVPALWVGAYELGMGMQHRTFDGEVYVERDRPAPAPLWVRLKSSAPTIATVPDSVRIDAGSTYVNIPVTSGDTVGTALIMATAPGYQAATFRVSVSRARIIAGPAAATTVGMPTPLFVWSTGVLPGCACTASSGATVQDSMAQYGFVRPTTQPIPVRVVISDTTLARLPSDTATIPAGLTPASLPGFVGLRTGAAPIRIEDRRTSFAQLTPLETDFSIDPARLDFWSYQTELAAGVGLVSGLGDAVVQTPSYAPNVNATLTAVSGRVGFVPPTVTLSAPTDSSAWFGFGAAFELVGVRNGIDTIVVSATGFRPDTALVRVGRGYLATIGPSVPTTIRQGDSVLVRLAFRTPTGAPARTAAATTLTFATSNTIAVRIGGTPVTSVVVPAGASDVSFWVRGLTVGAASLSVRGTDLIAFDAQGEVRTP